MTIPVKGKTALLIMQVSKIAKKIELRPDNIDSYENCEVMADLMDEPLVKEIQDEGLRKLIVEMRKLHREVRRANYPVYIETAKEIFDRISNRSYVIDYHRAEQLVKEIPEAAIQQIAEPTLRETLLRLKHIHNNIAEKKATVLRSMKLH